MPKAVPPAPAPVAPSPWPAVVALCLLYALAGVIGRDPWKGDDAVAFGLAWSALQSGEWLLPSLAGEPVLSAPPLPIWIGASLGHLLGGLLPAPDAIRLATPIQLLLLLSAGALAGARWHGRSGSSAVVLFILGTLGLSPHAHETQPVMALLVCQGFTLAGLAWVPRTPWVSALVLAAGLGGSWLAGALPGLILCGGLIVLAPVASATWRTASASLGIGGGLVLGGLLLSLWPLAVRSTHPEAWNDWADIWLSAPSVGDTSMGTLSQLLSVAAWANWPALPLAGWAVWVLRRHVASPQILLPGLSLLLALGAAAMFGGARSTTAMTLVLPLALLATAGLPHLRRGAANALSWFGSLTFGLLASLLWLGWTAMTFGMPARLANGVTRLEPGFVGEFSPWVIPGALLTVGWIIALPSVPAGPVRPIMRWAMGMTLVWCLTAWLWFPWIEHGKTFRPVAQSLAIALPAERTCVARQGLGASERASFHYYVGLETRSPTHANVSECNFLLAQYHFDAPPDLGRGWRQIWQGQRAGDRHVGFRLYQRTSRRAQIPDSPDPSIEDELNPLPPGQPPQLPQTEPPRSTP